MARKITSGNKVHNMSVRVSQEEYEILKKQCESGMSISGVLRRSFLTLPELCANPAQSSGEGGKAGRTDGVRMELTALRREIAAIGNNINQIARANNAGFYSADDMAQLKKDLAAVEKLFRDLEDRLEV